MPKMPEGTDQLSIVGVPKNKIKEFKELCQPKGSVKRRIPQWEMFVKILDAWTQMQQQINRDESRPKTYEVSRIAKAPKHPGIDKSNRKSASG